MLLQRANLARTVVLGAALAMLVGCGSAAPRSTFPPPRAAAGPPRATAGPPHAGPPVHASVERHLRVRAGVVALAASDGDLWVSGFGAVSRIDPASGRLIARVAAPKVSDLSQMAAGDGSVWVTTGGAGSVDRIDPVTNRVAAVIRTGGPALGVCVGAGRVWVARDTGGAGYVVRIDPRTNRVVGRQIDVGEGPGELACGIGSVWVIDTSPAFGVVRIDPATGHSAQVDQTLAQAIAVGYRSLWTTATGYLVRIDPRSRRIDGSIAAFRIPRASEIAIGAGKVWVLAGAVNHPATLWQIDPDTNKTVGTPVRLATTFEPIALAVTDAHVWAGGFPDTVIQLRLSRGTSRRRR